MLAGQLNQARDFGNKTQPIRPNHQSQAKREAKILNETLKSLRSRLVQGLSKDLGQIAVKDGSCNTDDVVEGAKPSMSANNQCLQTEEYLMYQMVENQLKHVYDNVNKMKADDTALKEKYRVAKNELKTERTAKEFAEKELEKLKITSQAKVKQQDHLLKNMKAEFERLQQANSELTHKKAQQQLEFEKCEKNLIAAEFKHLKLQEELKECKALLEKDLISRQQQTSLDSPRIHPSTILESDDQTEPQMDRLHVLQLQLTDQVDSLSERVQNLNVEIARAKTIEANLKEQLEIESQTVRALQFELKNNVQELSVSEYDRTQLTIKLQRASMQLDALREEKQRQEGQFADVMECFVQEKTSFIQSKKRQVEQQFIEMERSYRILFEENMELKKHLSEARSAAEALKKSFQEKQCQWNLEVSSYEKKLHEEALKRCCDCQRVKAVEQARDIATARINEERVALEKQLLEMNSLYLRAKQQHQRVKDLNEKLEKEATEKLKHLASRYQQLMEYNELLLSENMQLKKNRHGHSSSSKENERMRKLYISIWKDRFSSA